MYSVKSRLGQVRFSKQTGKAKARRAAVVQQRAAQAGYERARERARTMTHAPLACVTTTLCPLITSGSVQKQWKSRRLKG